MTLNLDLSTVSSGYCYEQDGKLKYGTIKPSKTNLPPLERISQISIEVLKMIDELGVDVLQYESLIIGKTASGSMTLGLLHGAIRIPAYQRGVEFREIHPSTLKKAFTGNGKADKEKMMGEASRRVGEQITNSDIADAIAVHYCCVESQPMAKKSKKKTATRKK